MSCIGHMVRKFACVNTRTKLLFKSALRCGTATMSFACIGTWTGTAPPRRFLPVEAALPILLINYMYMLVLSNKICQRLQREREREILYKTMITFLSTLGQSLFVFNLYRKKRETSFIFRTFFCSRRRRQRRIEIVRQYHRLRYEPIKKKKTNNYYLTTF